MNEQLLEAIIKFLWNSKIEFHDLAFWALSNVAGESDLTRDLLYSMGIIDIVTKYFRVN